ncbi:transcriptional regulator [Microbacterium lushaniae]|nr:transcriptional regulator [Microbacterium lushaniae]
MTRASASGLLVLHSVRLAGFADTPEVAQRFGLEPVQADDALRDFQRRGWVQHSRFIDLSGWSLTEAGKIENERQLARELDESGARGALAEAHRDFLPANARLLAACADWQVRPSPSDMLAQNDHLDPHWDAGVLAELGSLEGFLGPFIRRLSGRMARFGGYDTRFAAALRRARAGDHDWVDRGGVDSCHRVWFQLHEDLIATLGLTRGEAA